jgi:hypothetical protein
MTSEGRNANLKQCTTYLRSLPTFSGYRELQKRWIDIIGTVEGAHMLMVPLNLQNEAPMGALVEVLDLYNEFPEDMLLEILLLKICGCIGDMEILTGRL